MDYIGKLDDTKKSYKLPNGKMVTELEYLSLFMKEWNNGEVGKQSEAKNNNMHRTAKEVKDCTDRNNARNRDEYSISKARNLVVKMNPETLNSFIETEQMVTQNNMEDAMIEYLDQPKKFTNTRSYRKNKSKKT
jgi:hypothetical protein